VARGHALERRPRLEDLDRLALIHHPHAGAAMALVLDEPFVLEPSERGSHRCAPDPERLRQRHLDQALVRLQSPADDRLSDRVLGPPHLAVQGVGTIRSSEASIVNNLVDHDPANVSPWPSARL
jgi:hypothetical protein